MAIPWQTLPLEVWANVIKQADSVKDLAQCRLVCRNWDTFAENAMFSRRLTILNNDDFFNQLYYHIKRKPSLTQLIKHVQFLGDCSARRNKFYIELLKLVITPDIEILEAKPFWTDLGELFLEIIDNSNRPFDKIRGLPFREEADDGTYDRLQYVLRNSLHQISVDLLYSPGDPSVIFGMEKASQNAKIILADLHKFSKLTTFNLNDYDNSSVDLFELDIMLSKLECTEHLFLKLGITVPKDRFENEAEVDNWLILDVKKDFHVQTLHLQLSANNDDTVLVKYFLYKYPELSNLKVSTEISSQLDRILEEVRHIDTLHLSGSPSRSDEHNITKTACVLKSEFNRVKIDYCKSEFLRVKKVKSTGRTDFSLQYSSIQSTNMDIRSLSTFATGPSEFTHLEISLLKRMSNSGFNDKLFYLAIKYFPHVRKIKFGAENLVYQETEATLDKCVCMHLVGVNVDQDFITQMSSLAPNLKYFTVSGGLFLGKRQCNVIMPHSDLSTLVLAWSDSQWHIYKVDFYNFEDDENLYIDDCDPISGRLPTKDEFKVAYNAYLCVKTKLAPGGHYFLLTQGDKHNVHCLSKKEFDLHSQGVVTINVECASLSLLSMDFGSIRSQIRFVDGKMTNEPLFKLEFLQ